MHVLDRVDSDQIEALRAREEFFWLDVRDPSDAQIDELARLIGLPRLAAQDTKDFGQRPKIDQYGDRVLIVFFGAHDGQLVEVHVHVSGKDVVTVRRAPCAHLSEARRQAEDGRLRSEEEVVFRVLDALADSLAALLGEIGAEVDTLGQAVFERASGVERRRMTELRGELFRLSQYVVPQRDMLAEGGDLISRLPGLERDESRHLFRGIHDELVLVFNAIEYARELLSASLNVYLATMNNRLNETLKQLTLVSTIFLPLTFVTGFFGQNFGWMVGHIDPLWAFLVYGVGGLVVSAGLLYLFFRRQGFFEE